MFVSTTFTAALQADLLFRITGTGVLTNFEFNLVLRRLRPDYEILLDLHMIKLSMLSCSKKTFFVFGSIQIKPR
jgi:hypothetical protein